MSFSEEIRATLRQRYKLARHNVRDRAAREAAIAETLSVILGSYNSSEPIAAYVAISDETNLAPLFKRHNDQLWVLPRTQPDKTMTFHAWHQHEPLAPSEFNIFAPAPNATIITPNEIAVVLIPLVAFDDHGNRLGMGGGYYDRYLANLASNKPRIGIAFDCQHSASPLPREEWDVTLSTVVTESGMIEFNK